MHDSDHEGVVRIFVRHSYHSNELFTLIILYYAAQFFLYQECNITRHNFSYTRSVTIQVCTSPRTTQPIFLLKDCGIIPRWLFHRYPSPRPSPGLHATVVNLLGLTTELYALRIVCIYSLHGVQVTPSQM